MQEHYEMYSVRWGSLARDREKAGKEAKHSKCNVVKGFAENPK